MPLSVGTHGRIFLIVFLFIQFICTILCIHLQNNHSFNGNVISFLHKLESEELSGSSVIEIDITLDGISITSIDIGVSIDEFLTVRPWWWVEKEPYKWNRDLNDYKVVLRRFDKDWDPIFKHIVRTQYPDNCSALLLALEVSNSLDSFGNKFYNYANKKMAYPNAIMTPYMLGKSGNHLFDDKFCSHLRNFYECAFLPATTCPLPDSINLHRIKESFYSSADTTGRSLSVTEFINIMKERDLKQGPDGHPHGPDILGTTYHGLFTNNFTLKSSQSLLSSFRLLFTYGFLYRLNHHFRSLRSYQLHEWSKKQSVPFPTNGNCAAGIIRRLERVPPGGDAREWCRIHTRHPNGTCSNDITGLPRHDSCAHYFDYGCHSEIPFGAVTLEHVINATEAISLSSNVLLRSDDPVWLHRQLKNTGRNKTFFAYTPPLNHRSSSTGAADYMAAIQLASRCNALAGHAGSAVTIFFYNIMCVRHGNVTGACPDLYDFAQG